jgi:hypothetical protein
MYVVHTLIWVTVLQSTSDGTFYWVDGHVNDGEGVHAQWEDGQPA